MANNQLKPKIPVIFLAFANERVEGRFLRKLTIELKLIMNALEPAVQKGRIQLKILPAATHEEIAEVFLDEWYRDRIWIFHYGGHANDTQILAEDGQGGNRPVFATGLAEFLSSQRGLKLVFFNACATAEQARLLHESPIPSVIATSREIRDDQATDFAEVFYKGMAAGESIDEAFGEASGFVKGKYDPTSIPKELGTRSLYFDEEAVEEQTPDADRFPWRLYSNEAGGAFPVQWRLFYELKPSDEASATHAEAFLGQVIGNHRIEKLLGEGSMGSVFSAVHLDLNEERAIKITHRVLEGYEYLKHIIIVGHKGLANIKHPNIVTVFDVGEVVLFGEKRLYMIMELVKGERLDKLDMRSQLGDLKQLNVLADLAISIATGLEAAHKTKFVDETGTERVGIVHGNIKTRKILFTPEGIPKLIDFLFTDVTRSRNIKLDLPDKVKQRIRGERLETYYAPELLSGLTGANKQTDIYSLGAVFFEVVTGKSLADYDFKTEDSLHNFVKGKSRLFPKYLSKVIFNATHPDPKYRYDSVSKMIDGMLGNVSWFKRILYWFKRK
ncbi:MAG: protein kinase [Bacteroidota bacterium]